MGRLLIDVYDDVAADDGELYAEAVSVELGTRELDSDRRRTTGALVLVRERNDIV